MTFLDQLRQQALELQSKQHSDAAMIERRGKLVEAACQVINPYLRELAEHLNVISPTRRQPVEFGPKAAVDALTLRNFRYDARRKNLRDATVFDYMVVHWQACSGKRLDWHFDFVGQMEQLQARLRAGGVEHEKQEVRDPVDHRLLEVQFHALANLNAHVQVTPLHDEGLLRFELRNVEPFEYWVLNFAVHHVSQALLDELAKRILGEPHRFVTPSS